MTPKNIDAMLTAELDRAAESMGYLDEARALLEPAFDAPAPRPKHRLRTAAAVAVGTAAAAAMLLMFFGSSRLEAVVGPDNVPVPAGSWVSASLAEGRRISFSDGSAVRLEANTEVRLQALKEEGAHLLIERGSAAVSVVHREKTDWHVDAGPYRIAVTGTRFSVDWTPGDKEFEVAVQEGTVIVEGPMLAAGKPLSAGERIQVSLLDRTAEIYTRETYERIVADAADMEDTEASPNSVVATRTPVNENEALEAAAPPVSETTAERRRRPHRPSLKPAEAWVAFAKKGQWRKAVSAAEQAGAANILESGSVNHVILLGDAARLAGEKSLAQRAYRDVRRRFPGSAAAQRAAFSLGRIEFEANRRYAVAARWFRTCLADNPSGPMAKEAAGRLMEALHLSGDRTGAQKAAGRYLSTYRNGPHADLARQLLSKTSESL